MKRILIIITMIAGSINFGISQEKKGDLFELSLEDLLNIQISISTKTNSNIRETPGIITVITKDDIKNSGARDAIDLFQLYVPGFAFGVDVEGAVGMGVRGLWAHEGKFLFMVDGQELNDGMFATVPFGNHFTLENIERVEIIRGPGSAVYGGFAGVGVVSIITRGTEQNGGKISYVASHSGSQFTHNNLSFGTNVSKENLKICLSGTFGEGSRSSKNYVDYYGNSRSMKNASDIYTKQLNLKLNYKNFNFLSIIDDYEYTQIDLWDAYYTGPPLNEKFRSYFAQSSIDLKVTDKLTITPKLNYKWQQPWNLSVTDSINQYNNNKEFYKIQGGVIGTYTSQNIKINCGVEISKDILKRPSIGDTLFEETFNNGKKQLLYTNFASYGQIQINTKVANFTFGARYDKSSEFGDAFVPRIGLTRAFEYLHFKTMVSQSFRVPGGILPNRLPAGNPPLEPEKGTNYEVEFGFKLPFKSYLTLNAFDVSFDKVIMYSSEESGIGYYRNQGKVGTQGIEIDIKQVLNKLSTSLNFAYYKRKYSEADSSFMVPGKATYFLGFSPIRINGVINYKISSKYSVSISGSFFGNSYTYATQNSLNEGVLKKLEPMLLANINFTCRNILFEGIDASIGVYNILGTEFKLAQPYMGRHGPLPALDRSIGFKLSYEY